MKKCRHSHEEIKSTRGGYEILCLDCGEITEKVEDGRGGKNKSIP